MLRENIKAQATIEFTFGMIVIMFLIYGMIRVFSWTGMELAQRRMAQDESLINYTRPMVGLYGIDSSLVGKPDTNANWQLSPDFYRVQSMGAIYPGQISNEGNP